jgi:hypothetical protein
MPVHDWTRVDAGIFHHFHISWIADIAGALNSGLLPPEYYALAEQLAGGPGLTVRAAIDEYAARRRTVVIRHVSLHRVVALVEILSPGNKASCHALRAFLDKAVAGLTQGIHLLVADLFPPGPCDPQGIHGALWQRLNGGDYEPPPDKPLTLAAYVAGPVQTAYVEPVAVGDALPDMPLFLDPEQYINVPLEATYRAAYEGVPRFYRQILEAPAT